MRAIVWTKYGSPESLQLREVTKPTPKDTEVLIRVHAATVTLGDCEIRSLKLGLGIQIPLRLYAGLVRPKRISILGQELAGEIESVGKDVTRFRKGDRVFAATLFLLGAYAEYKCLPETYPILKPDSLTYEEAATIPTGGINGLHFVRLANLHAGDKVLINGAGGSIGTYAIQIAKHFGADVSAVDSAEKLDMLRSIGADHVIDYRKEDFTRRGETYDAIIDVVGKSSFPGSIRSLNRNGRYVLGNPSFAGIIRAMWTSKTTDKEVVFKQADYQKKDFTFLIELIEAGKIKVVIDRRFPLEQTAEAHRYVDEGHKKGNVTITVNHPVDEAK